MKCGHNYLEWSRSPEYSLLWMAVGTESQRDWLEQQRRTAVNTGRGAVREGVCLQVSAIGMMLSSSLLVTGLERL